MANSKLILTVLVAAAAVPASAAVTVLGSSSARMCYEAADFADDAADSGDPDL